MTTYLALSLLFLAAPPSDKEPARVTITAELACLHCSFGEGDGCAVCLKLDEETPVLLAGKSAEIFMEDRLTKKVVTLAGTLSLDKDKRLVLTSAGAAPEKDLPAKGQVRIAGVFRKSKDRAPTILNAGLPIELEAKSDAKSVPAANDGKVVIVTGVLKFDKKGALRLAAHSMILQEK